MNGNPHPDSSQETRLPVETLQPILEQMLIKKSMFQFDASTAVTRMLEADLYGIPAHGCGRIGEFLDAMDVGDIDPRGRVLTLDESETFALLDGSRAIGHVAATKATEIAQLKAEQSGLALVLVGNSQTLGAAGLYVRLLANQGLIGICLSSTGGATVSAPGTLSGAVGNSPVAYAVPVEGSHPLVFDSACGAHSWGKLEWLQNYGIPVPEGVAVDSAGQPTCNIAEAKAMQPAGGNFGFGLSLLCSVLAGPLCGGRMPLHKKRSSSAEDSQHVFIALDIGRFADPGRFQKELNSTLTEIRQLPPENPESPVRIPGDRQMQCFQEYTQTGIPLHHSVVDNIQKRAHGLKIDVPWAD